MQTEEEPGASRRAVSLTLAGLWAERGGQAFWPVASWALAGASVLALGAMAGLSARESLAVAGIWGAGLVALAGWGAIRFRRPDRRQARARVDSTLPGAPLSVLADRMALGVDDSDSRALWAAHQAAARQLAAHAQAVAPDAALARRDPFALRLVALTAGAMALIFGSAAPMGQGLAALALNFRPAPGAPAPELQAKGPGWEGWAEPPGYTRRPTIYLNALPDGDALRIPKGTVFSLRLYGEGLAVSQDIGAARPGRPDAPAFTAEHDGVVKIAGLHLSVEVEPDAAPRATLATAASRRADGRFVQGFNAQDDHGISDGKADITLDLEAVDRRFGLATAPDRRAAIQLSLPLPAGTARQSLDGRIAADLARHPWANLPVVVRLTVRDGIGQTGTAPTLHMVLPGRRFFNASAAALAELRRDLLWSGENREGVARGLRMVIWDPPGARPAIPDDLRPVLEAAIATLEAGALSEDARDTLATTLWDAAVKMEDGGLDDALAQMQAAQEKLSEAIRNGASPDEISRLMAELKAATDAYTQKLAERAPDPAERFDRSPRDGRMISGDQLQAMMDRIQSLMNEGRMAEAQELLNQFNRMMQSLKVTQGEGTGSSRPTQKLQDTLKQQKDLADRAMRRAQDPFGGDSGDQSGGADGQSGGQSGGKPTEGPGGAPGALAQEQQALREDLGRQRALLPGAGSAAGDQAGEALDRAARAMDDAAQALRDGDPAGAMTGQAAAIEALREGLRALDRAGRRSDGNGDSDQAEESPDADGGTSANQAGRGHTDPLGRSTGSAGGNIVSGDSLNEGADPAERARKLQDEIRRRSSQPTRPRDERDYLGRLLDRF